MSYLTEMYCFLRLQRDCNETCTIKGVTIPSGMPVMVPCYAIHHDPEIWPEPEKFDSGRCGDHPGCFVSLVLQTQFFLGFPLLLLSHDIHLRSTYKSWMNVWASILTQHNISNCISFLKLLCEVVMAGSK